MNNFKPIEHIENCQAILDNNEWPNFHDAEIHRLNFWRGDVRPDDDIWIGPVISATFELCALQYPYIVELSFHDCDFIEMSGFNHQNAILDIKFKLEGRGTFTNGEPLPPYICVEFIQAFGVKMTFKCFSIKAIGRKEIAKR